MKRTAIITAALVLLGGTALVAQSNEVIDQLLAREIADFGSSVYMVLGAGELIEESATIREAFSKFQALGWRLQSKAIDDPLTIGELSYLIMRSLDLSGGLMYTIYPSPRYAFRELVYKNVISKQTAPRTVVSGEEVLRYLGAVLRMGEVQ